MEEGEKKPKRIYIRAYADIIRHVGTYITDVFVLYMYRFSVFGARPCLSLSSIFHSSHDEETGSYTRGLPLRQPGRPIPVFKTHTHTHSYLFIYSHVCECILFLCTRIRSPRTSRSLIIAAVARGFGGARARDDRRPR